MLPAILAAQRACLSADTERTINPAHDPAHFSARLHSQGTAPRSYRLATRILIACSAILMLTTLALSVFLVFNTWREWQENSGAFARYLARAIALDVRSALLNRNADDMAGKLEAIGHTELVSLVCLYDTGSLAASYSRPGEGSICPATQNLGLAGHIHALETVYSDAEPVGYVTVHMRSNLVRAQTASRIGPVLLALLIASLAALGAIRYVVIRATRSLTVLTDYARTTSDNTPELPGIDGAPKEVTELSDAFRRLIEHLVDARVRVLEESESRHVAEGAERRVRGLLSDVINGVPHVIIVRRGDGSLLFGNRATAALYGVSLETLTAPEFMEHLTRPDGLLLHGDHTDRPQEISFTDPEGAQHHLLVSRTRIEGSDQELTIALDISEVHRLRTQLQFAQRLETVGTLAGGIAHDFNNLLTPILGYSTLLESMPLADDVKARLAHITSAAMKARDVVQQILTFSRQRPPARTRVAVQSLISDTVSLMRATIPPHITFSVEQLADSHVYADRGQLEQVLVNLVTNASQAIGDRPGAITIRSREDKAADGSLLAAIDVVDTGRGMSEDILGHIFEPFFTTKAIGEGSGLGLAVVHGIVQSHDGRIDVASTPGRGTTFTLLLSATGTGAGAGPGEAVATPA